MFKKFVGFIKAAGVALWNLVVKILTQVWALISDNQWDLDPWKIAGFVSYAFSGFLTLQVFEFIKLGKDAGVIGIAAGLAGGFITGATLLFAQSHGVDKALISKASGDGGQ